MPITNQVTQTENVRRRLRVWPSPPIILPDVAASLLRGLSFREEVGLLMHLNLGTLAVANEVSERLPSRRLARAVAAIDTLSEHERDMLQRALYSDVVLRPAIGRVHEERLEVIRAAWPSDLRAYWDGEEPELDLDYKNGLETGWASGELPIVSGRMWRAPDEIGFIVLLPDALRRRVVFKLAVAAFGNLLGFLTKREAYTYAALLEPVVGDWSALRHKVRKDLLDEASVVLVKLWMEHASQGAEGPEHLFSRFSTQVLAVCLATHRVEARAVERTLPSREGERLQRYLARLKHFDRHIGDRLRAKVVAGLLTKAAQTWKRRLRREED